MSFQDAVNIGSYKLVFQSYSQDSNDNYETEFALLDVYQGGKKIAQLAPEKRVYLATDQPSTIVANRSTLANDLYVIYAGRNATTGQPVIRIMLHPLINFIWIGVLIILIGTGIAIVPSTTRALPKPQRSAS
jgi:cytochrome c-type biogenesis protein CcmF